jgi:hypothetical protein
MADATLTAMTVGLPVRSMSGEPVGRVGALSPTAFGLLTDQGTVWLSYDAVFTADIGNVTLTCERNGITNYLSGASLRR